MRKLVLAAIVFFFLSGSVGAVAVPASIQVAINQSVVFRLVEKAKRVSVTQPEIAAVIVAEPNQLVVNGKAVGTTSLIVWDVKGNVSTFQVVVTTDVDALRRRLKALFPEENIQVSTSGLAIVLSGEVSNEVVYDKVLAIAQGYLPPKPPQEVAPAPATNTTVSFVGGPRLPKTGTAFAGGGELAFVEEGGVTDSKRWRDRRGIPEIIDLLKIKEFRQVELRVTVAEVSLTKMREIGVDFRVGDTFASGAGSQGGFSGLLTSAALMYVTRGTQVNAFFRLLQNRTLTDILARPKLVIKNGRSGGFLAGGEFPYPVPQSSGFGVDAITIEFKPFGVRLDFVPTITWSGAIDLRIFPEVSEIDERVSIQFAGFDIPGLRVRRSVSRLEIKPGELLILSGLLDRRILKDLTKFPLFGDIPVLGALFRSTNFKNEETELVFVIEPKIVSALPPGEKPELPQISTYDSPDMRQIPLPSSYRSKTNTQRGSGAAGKATPAAPMGPTIP